jgi:two-component system LytT family response regulator
MANEKLKALIIDDERLARLDLRNMLETVETVEVIGEAEDVPSGIEAIEKLKPNVVFLDIQMPGQTGFDLVSQIDFDGHIIFVTAYDEYALRAFEVNAMDYLMKPVTQDRLQKSLAKISEDKQPLDEEKKPKLTISDRLFTTVGSKVTFLKIENIILIQSDGDYTKVHTSCGINGLVTKTMKEWEHRLPKNVFCRVHRNAIINTEYIENMEKWFNYSYQIKLQDIDEPVIMSRRYAKKLKDIFG